MPTLRTFLGICVGLSTLAAPAAAEVYPLIIRGKVVMQDGSAPPKSVGIQRLCTDGAGSAPGPVTNGKGEYTWRMDVDPMRTRVCRLEATLAGYASTAVDISALNGYLTTAVDLPPITLFTRSPDPMTIQKAEADVPSRSRGAWKAAMKAIDAGDVTEVARQLQAVVEASPKFARGWHTLGIVQQNLGQTDAARQAYERAVEADPKLIPPMVALARLAIRAKDWPAAAKAAGMLIQADTKKLYPESYVHLAAARFRLNDLDGAEASLKEVLELKQKPPRAEFIYGRILDARGNHGAARERISRYLELEPNAPDAGHIRAYLQVLGKPEAAGVDPELELP